MDAAGHGRSTVVRGTIAGQQHATSASPHRRRWAWAWGSAVGIAVLLAPVVPALAPWLPACPLKRLTGIPCPGCGATRAALALVRGEPAHAFSHYPLWALVWVGLVAGGLVAGLWVATGRRLPWPRSPRWLWLGAALLLANWVFNVATGV